MNFDSLRSRTRALIQETTANRWTNARVDQALNTRYFEAQAALTGIGRAYFDTVAYLNLVANQAEYPRPFFRPVRSYARLGTDGGTTYAECRVYSEGTVTLGPEGDVSRIVPPTVFAVVERGVSIFVYPTPGSNQSLGLRVVSDYSTALTNPGDTPRIRASLHTLLADGAAAELLADDPTYPEAIRARLESRWDYYFAPEPEARKRLCRVYPERAMRQLTMEPPTRVNTGRARLDGGLTILY